MNSEIPKSRLTGEARTYAFDRFSFIQGRHVLMEGDRIVPLPLKTCELLSVLVENSGQILTKDELVDAVWKDTFVEESNLSHHIAALRKALGARENGDPFIETIRQRGYRFVGDVTQKDLVATAAGPPRNVEVRSSGNIYSVADWQREPAAEAEPSRPLEKRSSWRVPFLSSGAILLVTAIAFAMYKLGPSSDANAKGPGLPFSSSEVVRLTASGTVKLAAISPDGRYIAHVAETADGDTLSIRQVDVANDTRIYGPSDSELVWVDFAPDGSYVYFERLPRDRGEPELVRMPLLGGPTVVVHRDGGATTVSPDGTKLAFMMMTGENESRLFISDADGSNERALVSRSAPDHLRVTWYAPAWSPDGRSLAFPVTQHDEKGRHDTVLAVDVDTGVERKLTDTRWQQVGQPRWLAGEILVTASETSTVPKQLWHVSLLDGETRRITRDLNNYDNLSVTSDGGHLAAVQRQVASSIWSVTGEQFETEKQIISEVGWLNDLTWMPDGRIGYISAAGGTSEVWTANPDGTDTRQLTVGVNAGLGLSVMATGRHIVFSGGRGGRSNLWRVDLDGSNLTQLTGGEGEFFPQCTPDGQWIVYQSTLTSPSIWKVPVGGGEPTRVADRGGRPSVSPNGALVAYHYLDGGFEKSRWGIGVSSIVEGTRVRRFDFPPTVVERTVRWSRDGNSLAYINSPKGISNIYRQPIEGGKAAPITNFDTGGIVAYDWNSDGSAMAIIRVKQTRDVVRLSR